MRPALYVFAATALAIAIPSVSQAGTICSDCPKLVDSDSELIANGAVVVVPESSPFENRYEVAALKRIMLVTQALEGESGNGNGNGMETENPPDVSDPPPTDGGGGGGAEPVPEPATGLLTALGVMALAIGRRRA
jgi:hypothetical protein